MASERLKGTPIEEFEQFINSILDKLNKLGIDVSGMELDHLGYQSSSSSDFEKLKLKFAHLGKMVDENVVGGRRVALFKLIEPILYKDRSIPAIELIEPKQGQLCPSALEHIEFVLTSGFNEFLNEYPNISWDVNAIDQPMFPMVKLKLDDNIQVKFHLEPVLKIVAE